MGMLEMKALAVRKRFRSATGNTLGRMNQSYVYANGQQVASLDGAGKLDVVSRMTAFSNSSSGKTQVVVQAGEDLRNIAQRVYGNANLWYVLAAANALDGEGGLVAGTTLTVPEVKTSSNDANTFKPYNPGEITGPTSPGLPYIEPPSNSQCNPLAAIIRVVVAVVVMVYAPYMGSAYSALVGGLGEAAAQKVEINAGDRQGFDFGSIGVSALSAGFAASSPAAKISSWTGVAANAPKIGRLAIVAGATAATNYTVSHAINKALGEDVSFSWRSMASGVVSAAIGASVFGSLGSRVGPTGAVTNSVTPSGAFSWQAVTTQALSSIGRQAIGHVVDKAITGQASWN